MTVLDFFLACFLIIFLVSGYYGVVYSNKKRKELIGAEILDRTLLKKSVLRLGAYVLTSGVALVLLAIIVKIQGPSDLTMHEIWLYLICGAIYVIYSIGSFFYFVYINLWLKKGYKKRAK